MNQPYGLANKRWAQRANAIQFGELAAIRATAGQWRNGLAGLTALVAEGQPIVAEALGVRLDGLPVKPAPTMRLVPLPDGVLAAPGDSDSLYEALSGQGIEVAPIHFDGLGYLRIARNSQYLWMRKFQAAAASSSLVAAGDGVLASGAWSSARSTSLPSSNVAPARTSATRCGALTRRQRRWADSMSL